MHFFGFFSIITHLNNKKSIVPVTEPHYQHFVGQYYDRSSRDSSRLSHSLHEDSWSQLPPDLPIDRVELYDDTRPIPDLEISRDSARSDDSYGSHRLIEFYEKCYLRLRINSPPVLFLLLKSYCKFYFVLNVCILR